MSSCSQVLTKAWSFPVFHFPKSSYSKAAQSALLQTAQQIKRIYTSMQALV